MNEELERRPEHDPDRVGRPNPMPVAWVFLVMIALLFGAAVLSGVFRDHSVPSVSETTQPPVTNPPPKS